MSQSVKKQAKAVNKQADKLFKNGMYADAIKLYVESVNLMREAGDQKAVLNYQKELNKAIMGRSQEENDKADKMMKEGKYKEAVEVYQRAYDLLEKAGPDWIKKKGANFQKELYKAKGKYGDQLNVETENLIKSKSWSAAANLIIEFRKTIDKKVDEKLYTKFTADIKKIYERWADEENHVGDSLYKEKKFEEAIEKYAKAFRLIEKSGNEKKKKNYRNELLKTFEQHAKEINSLGDKLMKEKKYPEAAELYAQSVQIAENSEDNKLIANFQKEMQTAYQRYAKEINTEGDKLMKAKNYPEAAEIYRKSVEIAEQSKDANLVKNFKSEFMNAMGKSARQINERGDIAMKAQKFDEAFKLYKKSLEMVKETGNAKGISTYTAEYHKACEKLAKEINHTGDAAYKEGDYEKAYTLYDRSVKLMEITGNQKAIKNYSKERNKALTHMNE